MIIFIPQCFFQIFVCFEIFLFQNYAGRGAHPPTSERATSSFSSQLYRTIIFNSIVCQLIKNNQFRTRCFTHTNAAIELKLVEKYRMLYGRKVDLTWCNCARCIIYYPLLTGLLLTYTQNCDCFMFLSDRKNMYALVAFSDGKKIVPIESIRNFNPKNFNKKKKYNVLWDEDGMYYDGVILCVKGNFRLLSAFNYHVFFVYMCISMYFQKLNACQIPKKKSRPKRTIEGYPFLTLHFVNQRPTSVTSLKHRNQ